MTRFWHGFFAGFGVCMVLLFAMFCVWQIHKGEAGWAAFNGGMVVYYIWFVADQYSRARAA